MIESNRERTDWRYMLPKDHRVNWGTPICQTSGWRPCSSPSHAVQSPKDSHYRRLWMRNADLCDALWVNYWSQLGRKYRANLCTSNVSSVYWQVRVHYTQTLRRESARSINKALYCWHVVTAQTLYRCKRSSSQRNCTHWWGMTYERVTAHLNFSKC